MRKVLLVAATALLPLAASAHMTWLMPNATVVTNRDGSVSIDAAVSEDLFIFERALKLEDLRITGPAGAKLEAKNRLAAKNHESFDLDLPGNGTYRISNVGTSLMGAYKAGTETKRFRATADTLAKELPADAEVLSLARTVARQQTFVSREEAGDAKFTPEGDGLELLPLTQVTDLSTGDSSRVRLLLDGKPLANTDVTLRPGGNRYRYKTGEITLKTDAQGELTIKWTEAGQWWLGANYGDRRAQGGTRDKPLERAALSVTFEVLPK
jgi:uncharacterized GH25 family protein